MNFLVCKKKATNENQNIVELTRINASIPKTVGFTFGPTTIVNKLKKNKVALGFIRFVSSPILTAINHFIFWLL